MRWAEHTAFSPFLQLGGSGSAGGLCRWMWMWKRLSEGCSIAQDSM